MKKVFLSLILLCISTGMFAQSPDYAAALVGNILAEVIQSGMFVLALYEVVIRFFPTVKSYSLLSQIIAVIQVVVPDRNTEGGTHAQLIQSLTISDLRVGDTVETKEGDMKILEIAMNGSIAAQSTTTGDHETIGLDDILIIVKKGYVLVDAIKAIISFFKSIFKKA